LVSRTTRAIERVPGVADASAMIGGAYPQVLLSRAPRLPSKDSGDILVRTEPSARTDRIASRLREVVAAIPGANISVEEIYTGPGVEHPITIRVYGDEYEKLREYAEEVKSLLRAQRGTINVSDSLSDTVPVTRVTLDAARARGLGITPAQVGATLRYLYGGDKLTEFLVNGKTVEVALQEPAPRELPFEQIEQTPLSASGTRAVPLAAVGGVSLGHSFAQLMRRNTRRVVEIVADVDGTTLPAAVLGAVDPVLRSKTWAAGYGYQYAGEQEETEKSFRNLAIAAIGSLIVIFIIIITMFDSFSMGLATIAAVPYALIGALSGLAVMHEPFGFMAFLGLISLIGVYVNHKIYFVDRFLELTGRGQSLSDAIRGAGADRLRPVVLTALTAVLGLLPLTIGGGVMWRGFGWVGVFGLTASIPLSLVLLPAFIAVAHRLTHRRKWSERRATNGVAEPSMRTSRFESDKAACSASTLSIDGGTP
jgi:multidrug efflux pump subunit AcrB